MANPGDLDCSSCDPPVNIDAPTEGGCVPLTAVDPCATSTVQTEVCHNTVCDERFADLPTSKRLSLIGIVGKCFYRFANRSIGFLVSDNTGQYITNRPCIKIPFLKSFLTDPSTGEVIPDLNGDPTEGPVPEFDSMIVADECGCQNRVQGTSGKSQDLLWNGVSFEFTEHIIREENPLLNPEDVPIVDFDNCPAPLIAALIPSSEQVVGSCGDEETVFGFKIGGISNFGQPIGTMQMWAGSSTNVPSGYLLCDGTQYDTAVQPALFAAIGYGFGGAGNVFNVPDTRGRFLRGVDGGQGNDPDAATRIESAPGGNVGDSVGSLQVDSMQCFRGSYDKYVFASENVVQATAGSSKSVAKNSNQYDTTDITFVDAGCGEPRFGDETRPKNLYINHIIFAGCPVETA